MVDGHLTEAQIATRLKVSVSTFKRWKETPEFEDRVEDLINQYQVKLASRGYAIKAHRIALRMRRLREIQATMDERAKDYAYFEITLSGGKKKRVRIPGGKFGLVVAEPKGDSVQYSVDTALMSEERAHLVEIGIEVGDWKTKVEHSGNIGGNLSEVSIALAKAFSLEQIEAAQEKVRLLESGNTP